MSDFDNVIIEAETLGIVYDFVKSYLEDTENEIKWYKERFINKTKNEQELEDWATKGWAIETKRKQVLLTVISNLHKQLFDEGKVVL